MKSTPIVGMKLSLKTSSYIKMIRYVIMESRWKNDKAYLPVILTANLRRRDDLPTPEFPIRRTLKR